MQLPPGSGYDKNVHVAKLKKALYGLKQGGRTWYQLLYRALVDLGFKRTEYDHSVFFLRQGNDIVYYHWNHAGSTRWLQDKDQHYLHHDGSRTHQLAPQYSGHP